MHYLNGRAWALILGLSVIPILADEITKYIYRLTGFGKRVLTDKSAESTASNGGEAFRKRNGDGKEGVPMSPNAEVAPSPRDV